MRHTYFDGFRIITFFLLLSLLVGCSKGSDGNGNNGGDKPTPSKEKIVIPPESQAIFNSGLRMDKSSTSQTVKFTASDSWTATVTTSSLLVKAASWITISPTSGNAGNMTITVRAQENISTNSRTATISIKCSNSTKSFSVLQSGVSIVPVSSITLNKTTLSLAKGNSEILVATITPDNATDKTTSWSSSSSSVASIDNTGKVTALSGGSATITASAGGKSATCIVTVTVPITSITLNKTSLTLVSGTSETLTATISPNDATAQTVEWSSSNSSVASIDNTGKITAQNLGTAVITAICGGKSATCNITVVKDGNLGDRDGDEV